MTTRTRRSSAARGSETNTAAHKQARKLALADLARRPGQPCARCGLPMYPAQPLDLDHSDDRLGYLGLSHRACNRRDGQRKTTAILRARGWTPSPQQLRAMTAKRRQPREVPAPPLPLRSSRVW